MCIRDSARSGTGKAVRREKKSHGGRISFVLTSTALEIYLFIISVDVYKRQILGDGPEKENLIALSQTLKIEENVFFIGEVSNHKISAYHQACDLFLFSSKSETQGIVLLEAMAAYLPVFAIRATGVCLLYTSRSV